MCIESSWWLSKSLQILNFSFILCLLLSHTCALLFTFWINLSEHVFAQLDIHVLSERSSWLIISHDFILTCDDSDFHGIWFSFDAYGFFHVVMGLLLSPEALHFMLSHSMVFLCDLWDILDETNHGLITLWIKLVISILQGSSWRKM